MTQNGDQLIVSRYTKVFLGPQWLLEDVKTASCLIDQKAEPFLIPIQTFPIPEAGQ